MICGSHMVHMGSPPAKASTRYVVYLEWTIDFLDVDYSFGRRCPQKHPEYCGLTSKLTILYR